MRRLLTVLVLMFAAACRGAPAPAPETIVTKEDLEFAQRFLSYLPVHDFDAAERAMNPKMKGPKLRPSLEQLAKLFPGDAPRSVRTVGGQRRRNGAITFINVTLEYEYPSSWLLAELLLQRTANGVVVDAVHVQPTPHRLAYINRFTFAGKGVWHYVFFAVALLVPMVMGIAFVQVFRTPGLQLRWLWAAIVLIGAGRFTLNWTTNRVSIILLAIQVLGSGFTRLGPDAPYLIATSVPVGAILFFIKRLTGIGEWDEMADGKGADMGQGPGEMGHGPGEGMGQGPGDMGHGPDGMADGGTTTDSAKPDE